VGNRNYLTDPKNNFSNLVGIETRGSSSSGFPQQSYGFETRNIVGLKNDTILLGMPTEHDWILYAPYNDKTCMRNVLTYDIANKTGQYASRTKFCELVIDGQYQGIYVLMEKIKRDANRVNISKLLATDISGDQLTGGYIIKVDRDDGPGSYWTSPYPSATGSSINFVHVYPKNGNIVPQQRTYIEAYIDSVEDALASPTFTNTTTGYAKYIDVNSFIDYYLLNEVSKNVDGYRLSTFFYKDKYSVGGKLHAGPAWDYNLAWWNADYCDGSTTAGWSWDFASVCSGDSWQPNFWWGKLLQDPNYADQVQCRWRQLRLNTLSVSVLNNYVDSIALVLNESQARHFTAWPILGIYTWPNPSPIPADYNGEIVALKTWISNRILWMDVNLPGSCTVGLSNNKLRDENITVFPNPFTSTFKVNFYLNQDEKLKVFVTDLIGNVVFKSEEKSYSVGENTLEILLNDAQISNGMYLLNVVSANGTLVKKITKGE